MVKEEYLQLCELQLVLFSLTCLLSTLPLCLPPPKLKAALFLELGLLDDSDCAVGSV